MGTLLSYSGLSTKIRAMQSRLMTEKQYQEIAQMESVTQVVAYLKRQPGFAKLWADLDESSLHRGEIEKLPDPYHPSKFCKDLPIRKSIAENLYGFVF